MGERGNHIEGRKKNVYPLRVVSGNRRLLSEGVMPRGSSGTILCERKENPSRET